VTFDETTIAQRLNKGVLALARHRRRRRSDVEPSDPPHLPRLLRLGGEWRGEEAAGKAGNECASGNHGITSSARSSSDRGSIATESLPARVVSLEHIFNAMGTGHLDLYYCFLAGCGEMGHARWYHDVFPGPDRFELRGIPQFAPAD